MHGYIIFGKIRVITMFLYHGTSETIARQALTRGLLPRNLSGVESVWDDYPSNPEFVYVTTAYAPYFALHAAGDSKLGIVEIDLDCLDPDELYPDEDFLEQVTQGKGPAPKGLTMEGRTNWYRDNLMNFQHHWADSLDGLGNAAHYGGIPASAITRISIYDPDSNPTITIMASDPAITIMNYRFLGSSKYRALTSWFMGDPVDPSDIDPTWMMLQLPDIPPMMKEHMEKFEQALQVTHGLEVIENPNFDDTDCGQW